jgi:DNA-directed RNA polymerase specialized sigma24 family protein
VDGEDVALSAFDSFVRAAEAGRFPRLEDRNDLWQVLLLLTARKAANVLRNEGRLKKGGGAVILGLGGESDPNGLLALAAEPDPAEAAVLAEQADQLLQALGNDELRRVAVWAFEGYSNQEIAAKMGRSVATSERKLRRIREIWSAYTRE